MPSFIAAFDALDVATQTLRDQRPTRDIHIAALPSIAQLWLPERLRRIRVQMPEINISVTALESLPNLKRELFDLAIFFHPTSDDREQIEIEHDVIFPVCAPNLAADLACLDDLQHVPRLHDQTWADDWIIWSQSVGVVLENPSHGPRYSLYSLAVEEAKTGAGVLMGHASLVHQALLRGDLVRPFEQSCLTGQCLAITLPEYRKADPDLDRVVSLLTELNPQTVLTV